eukprot:gene7985-5545_t
MEFVSNLIDQLSQSASTLLDVIKNQSRSHTEAFLSFSLVPDSPTISAKYIQEGERKTLAVEVNRSKADQLFLDIANATNVFRVTDTPLGVASETECLKHFIVTSSVARAIPRDAVYLALILMPGNPVLWNIKEQYFQDSVSECEAKDVLLDCMRELQFSSLLLSLYDKGVNIWHFRKSVMKTVVQLQQASAEYNLVPLFEYDLTVLFGAAHSHTMNYNAWNYHREIIMLLNFTEPASLDYIRREVDSILSFIAYHNGDRSACSFLVFLWTHIISPYFGSLTTEFWKKWLYFSQREIRRHCELGHECMWELRLNLMRFALTRPVNADTFLSDWTIEDELMFISTYVDGYGNNCLLSPSSGNRAWYENTGGIAWTSFFAAKYGTQFLSLLVHADRRKGSILFFLDHMSKESSLYVLSAESAEGQVHASDVRFVIATDDQTILSASRDQTAAVSTVCHGESVVKQLSLVGHQGFVNFVLLHPGLPFIDGQKCFVTGSNDDHVVAWPASTCCIDGVLDGHSKGVSCGTILRGIPDSCEGQWNGDIVTGDWSGLCIIFDNASGKAKQIYSKHQNAIRGVAQLPGTPLVVSGSGDKTAHIWNITTGDTVQVFSHHEDVVQCVCAISSEAFATGSNDATVAICKVGAANPMTILRDHLSLVYGVAWNKATNELLSCSEDRTVIVWGDGHHQEDYDKFHAIQAVAHPTLVWTVAALPCGDIVTGTADTCIRVWTRDESKFASPERIVALNERIASQAIDARTTPAELFLKEFPPVADLGKYSGKEGERKMFKNTSGEVELYIMSGQSWEKWHSSKVSTSLQGIKLYDYLFDVDVPGGQVLKLPYNSGESITAAARRFMNEHPTIVAADEFEQVKDFIFKNISPEDQKLASVASTTLLAEITPWDAWDKLTSFNEEGAQRKITQFLDSASEFDDVMMKVKRGEDCTTQLCFLLDMLPEGSRFPAIDALRFNLRQASVPSEKLVESLSKVVSLMIDAGVKSNAEHVVILRFIASLLEVSLFPAHERIRSRMIENVTTLLNIPELFSPERCTATPQVQNGCVAVLKNASFFVVNALQTNACEIATIDAVACHLLTFAISGVAALPHPVLTALLTLYNPYAGVPLRELPSACEAGKQLLAVVQGLALHSDDREVRRYVANTKRIITGEGRTTTGITGTTGGPIDDLSSLCFVLLPTIYFIRVAIFRGLSLTTQTVLGFFLSLLCYISLSLPERHFQISIPRSADSVWRNRRLSSQSQGSASLRHRAAHPLVLHAPDMVSTRHLQLVVYDPTMMQRERTPGRRSPTTDSSTGDSCFLHRPSGWGAAPTRKNEAATQTTVDQCSPPVRHQAAAEWQSRREAPRRAAAAPPSQPAAEEHPPARSRSAVSPADITADLSEAYVARRERSRVETEEWRRSRSRSGLYDRNCIPGGPGGRTPPAPPPPSSATHGRESYSSFHMQTLSRDRGNFDNTAKSPLPVRRPTLDMTPMWDQDRTTLTSLSPSRSVPQLVRLYSVEPTNSSATPQLEGAELLPTQPSVQGMHHTCHDRFRRTAHRFVRSQPPDDREELERLLSEYVGREEELCTILSRIFGDEFDDFRGTPPRSSRQPSAAMLRSGSNYIQDSRHSFYLTVLYLFFTKQKKNNTNIRSSSVTYILLSPKIHTHSFLSRYFLIPSNSIAWCSDSLYCPQLVRGMSRLLLHSLTRLLLISFGSNARSLLSSRALARKHHRYYHSTEVFTPIGWAGAHIRAGLVQGAPRVGTVPPYSLAVPTCAAPTPAAVPVLQRSLVHTIAARSSEWTLLFPDNEVPLQVTNAADSGASRSVTLSVGTALDGRSPSASVLQALTCEETASSVLPRRSRCQADAVGRCFFSFATAEVEAEPFFFYEVTAPGRGCSGAARQDGRDTTNLTVYIYEQQLEAPLLRLTLAERRSEPTDYNFTTHYGLDLMLSPLPGPVESDPTAQANLERLRAAFAFPYRMRLQGRLEAYPGAWAALQRRKKRMERSTVLYRWGFPLVLLCFLAAVLYALDWAVSRQRARDNGSRAKAPTFSPVLTLNGTSKSVPLTIIPRHSLPLDTDYTMEPLSSLMFGKGPSEMDTKGIQQEMSSLYGIRDFSDCVTLPDLQAKLARVRDTRPITHGFDYGPILQHGNTRQPSGIVFLSHGLGDSAEGWDDVGRELGSRLPHLLFLLPTAPHRAVTINGGMPMPAWYDIYGMIQSGLKSGKQDGVGVMQSVDYLASLAHVVSKNFSLPTGRVVYAGFSQGAAISLAAGLTAAVPPAGIAAMSGYLAALNTLLPRMKNKVPTAMFHGTMDPVVPIEAARESRDLLKSALGIEAEFHEYRMQHSAVPEEIQELVKFIGRVLPDQK